MASCATRRQTRTPAEDCFAGPSARSAAATKPGAMLALEREARPRKLSADGGGRGKRRRGGRYLSKGEALRRVNWGCGGVGIISKPRVLKRRRTTSAPKPRPVPQRRLPNAGKSVTMRWSKRRTRRCAGVLICQNESVRRSVGGRRPRSGRSSRQCRESVQPRLGRRGQVPWTPEEDAIICGTQAVLGNKWSAIAQKLPGAPTTKSRTAERDVEQGRTRPSAAEHVLKASHETARGQAHCACPEATYVDKRVPRAAQSALRLASDYFSEDDEHGTTPTGDLPRTRTRR